MKPNKPIEVHRAMNSVRLQLVIGWNALELHLTVDT